VKSAEAIITLIGLARGERRYSLDSRETEEVLNIALALLSELAVSCDRIDRLERLLAERTGMPLADLRAVDYVEGPAAQEREDAMNALVARVLRIRLDPRARSTEQT
jgi:Cu/Ag efflux pump CusA